MGVKYQAIVDHIKNEAVHGGIKPGGRLPSIREIALRYDCNKATAVRAYLELEREHIIYAVPQSGYYLVKRKNDPLAGELAAIDFASAAPAPEALPYREFQTCINQAIEEYQEDLFAYNPPEGLPTLRRVLAHSYQDHQVFADEENIVITSGSQQALFILAGMEFPNGKQHVLVEQPTFAGMIGSCLYHGVKALGIRRDEDGIDLEELERVFRNGNIKFFYTIPRFHNPLGTSLTNEQKKAILKLAIAYDVYIVEDDYLADLETDSKSDPFYAFDNTAHVIYIRSYSKTLMPGLRLGAAVLPPILVNTFRERKRSADLSSSALSQAALELFISSGMYANHTRQICQLYGERMQRLGRLWNSLIPEGGREFPSGGLFAGVTLPCGAEALAKALEVRRVRVVNADKMLLTEFRRGNQIRLSVCQADPARMEEGIAVIAEEIRRLTLRKGTKKNGAVWSEDL